ncbi:hypothetical protein C6P45_004849 [Maudiozyma exigua]|uniref:LAA1-like C-terminal TPR repeats domain-containing protein n=1 Tax=Maudiozyma exigua TaxID=34358 RepID=A0A9P6WC35_MAUEX|nr:hypothetical protein C6P45_004849 [Kazachstania exigua]
MSEQKSLKDVVETSTNVRHDISSWLRINFEEVIDDTNQENKTEELPLEIIEELSKFSKHITEIEDLTNLESHNISIATSQLLCSSLCRISSENMGKIYNTAELMSNILAEENVSEQDKDDKSKNKKSNSKKTYTYTFPKELAATCLIQLFELFAKDIHSLVPFLLPIIFKNIKKILEKSKHFHALYSVTLSKLLRSMFRNTNGNFFDTTYSSKFTKLSKSVFEEMNNKQIDYPVDFISALIECWTFIFKQESYITEHNNDIMETIYIKFWKSEIAVYGISNDYTRIITAKALAEIIFDYKFTKKVIDLEQALEFYVKIFRHSHSRDVRAGCFESVTQFLTMNLLADSSFLHDCKYLYILQRLSAVFSLKNTTDRRSETIIRWLNMFKSLHKLILPHISEASKTQILFTLLGLRSEESLINNTGDRISFPITVDSEQTNQWYIMLQLDIVELLLLALSSSFTNGLKMRDEVKEQLIKLSISDLYVIRLYSNRVLKIFLVNFPDLLTPVISHSLSELSNTFDNKNKAILSFAQLHGHALIIANLVSAMDKDYVPYELIMRITVFATSFIKNHTTSTNGDLYFKGLVCWILLAGLMNYKDCQYLSTQKAQLLLFWKVLLTHSFTYRNEEELFRNLKTRTHALTCLLTFLSNADINKDLSTQLSYLLTKCSNFNHSVELKSARIDDALLENENRIVQIYLQLQEFIRYDFNSSLLILIMKNFSDPNLYIEPSSSILPSVKSIKKISKKDDTRKEKVLEYTIDGLLRSEDNFGYGISSKIVNEGIIELNSKNIENRITDVPGLWSNNADYWYKTFENEVKVPISRLLSNDSLVLLFGTNSYANGTLYMPKVTTSLIDFSMELFSSVFPYLNSNIQYSLIENLNLALFSKNTTLMRSVAISANICTALYTSLQTIERENISLDKSVGTLMLESIRKVEFNNDNYLTCLKSNCVGLIISAVRRDMEAEEAADFIEEQCNIIIKGLSDNDEPFVRMLNILSLSSIYQRNANIAKFENLYEVLFTMMKDPHPVIHSWSLKALDILLKKHSTMKYEQISTLLIALLNYMLNPQYGYCGSSTLRYNYNFQYNSHYMIASIINTIVENVGPNLSILNSDGLTSFQNICLYLVTNGDLPQQLKGIKIYEKISIFKLNNVLSDGIFIQIAENFISNSLSLGIGSSYFDTTFTSRHELISRTCSIDAALQCFEVFEQLARLQKGNLFFQRLETTCWRYLALYPNYMPIRRYFKEWLKQTPDTLRWLEKLRQMYEMTNGKLFKNISILNYNILIERGVLNLETKEITSELEEKMENRDDQTTATEKLQLSDALQWSTKETILGLLAKLCIDTQDDGTSDKLSSKIPELIKLSFNATSTNIEPINKLGLSILHIILKMFTDIPDPEYAQKSILEQHEAQISSALVSVFHTGSSPDVITMAINVGAEIIYSGILPSITKSRIAQLLIKLLDTFDTDSTNLIIGTIEISTKTAKRKIELAVLNSWAKLTQYSIETSNEILITFTKTYWSILIPLWIVSLREYMILNYEGTTLESDHTRLALYQPVWLNMIKAVSSLLFIDKQSLLKCMNSDELDSFMFALASRCLDEILHNIDNDEVKLNLLGTVHGIFKCNILLQSIFSDDIFSEIIGIFNRLISTGSSSEKIAVIEIINDLLRGYRVTNPSHEEFLAGIDKLYELLKLLMFIISDLLPFIKVSDMQNTLEQEIKITKLEQGILRRAVGVLEENINQFDEIFKVDLYACQLFIIGRVYLSKSVNDLLPIFLPLLKNIVSDMTGNDEGERLLTIFYKSTCQKYDTVNDSNRIATFLVLLTNGFNSFNDEDFRYNVQQLSDNIDADGTSMIIISGLQKIVENVDKFESCKHVMEIFMKELFLIEELPEDIIISALNILVTFSKQVGSIDETKYQPSFLLCMLFICKHQDTLKSQLPTVTAVMRDLAKLEPGDFKLSIQRILQTEYKKNIESIIGNIDLDAPSEENAASVELKTFK